MSQQPSVPASDSPPELVFVDLDRTLISGYSISAFALERMLSRQATLMSLWNQARAFALYLSGRWDYERLTSICMSQLAGEDAGELALFSERVYRRHLRRRIYPEARRLVRRHLAAGRHVVMVTSASRFQAAPVARSLRIAEICCTELEVVDGYLTGHAETCFGVGKLLAARAVAERLGSSLVPARFYTDSEEDLPLLEGVGKPVVVNPKPGLRRIANRRRWPVLEFTGNKPARIWPGRLGRSWRQGSTSVVDRLRRLGAR